MWEDHDHAIVGEPETELANTVSGFANPVDFEAVLYPNQPPNGRVFSIVLLAVALILAMASIGFILAGAWPVSGFLGLDVLLLLLAFRWSRREAERLEHIRLDPSGLHVRCVNPGGSEHHWRFNPAWVRVEMDKAARPESNLKLQQQGLTLTLGRFLTPDERLDLANALRSALSHYHN